MNLTITFTFSDPREAGKFLENLARAEREANPVQTARREDAIAQAHGSAFDVSAKAASKAPAEPPATPEEPAAPKAAPARAARQAPKPAAGPVIIPTEHGEASVHMADGKTWIASLGLHAAKGASQDEALANLLDTVEKAQASVAEVAQKPVVTKVTPARQAAPSNGSDDFEDEVKVPPTLLQAQSFRNVMTWMLDNKIDTKEAIIAKCDELREHVPAIKRLAGPLDDRIERALKVMVQERAAAN